MKSRSNRHGERWTRSEDQTLRDETGQGLSLIEIANRHARSTKAIEMRQQRLAILDPEQSPAGSSPQGQRSAPKTAQPGTKSADPTRSPQRTPADTPTAILSAWIAMELLSPRSFTRRGDLAPGKHDQVLVFNPVCPPWRTPEPSPAGSKFFYEIHLGAILMDAANAALKSGRVGQANTRPAGDARAVVATVLVDEAGSLLPEFSVAIASFAWALRHAMVRDFDALRAWQEKRDWLAGELASILLSGTSGTDSALTGPAVVDAQRWLIDRLAIDQRLVDAEPFVVRLCRPARQRTAAANAARDSYFLADLTRCRSHLPRSDAIGTAPLLAAAGPRAADLLQNRQVLEAALTPSFMPRARWPVPGGFPLVILQQAAVNLVCRDPSGTGRIKAVNGPPGTGKTTLLRDIIASVILDRARAMVRFDDPKRAFSPAGHRRGRGSGPSETPYVLDPALKGHEILVVSSNNKAVENITRELPESTAIGRSADELDYFRTVSDGLRHDLEHDHVGNRPVKPTDAQPQTSPTWGLISAALGNATNRGRFRQSFWWNEDRGFRLYLKAACGDVVTCEIRDGNGEVVGRRTPEVVLRERPSTGGTAAAQWQTARQRFLALDAEVEGAFRELDEAHRLCAEATTINREIKEAEAAVERLILDQRRYERWPETNAAAGGREDTSDSREGADPARHTAQSHATPENRSGFLASGIHRLRDTLRPVLLLKARTMLRTFRARWRNRWLLGATRARLTKLYADRDANDAALRPWRRRLGDRLIDAAFFERGPKTWNLGTPWVTDDLHRKREDLFVAAMMTHRAFINAAPGPFLHNLEILMKAFARPQHLATMGAESLADLWSTLFCVVPVISTTFASFNQTFGGLGRDGIGWLLIDEAGQTAPQAAIGAVERSRRIVAVGDPFQIPPVVTLPERLVRDITKHFGIDAETWAAPAASVQTLADRISSFRTALGSGIFERHVGIPLLVHRRSQEPMFSISNELAYDGQMVHAPTAGGQSAIAAVLGESRWFDIAGEATEKQWCRQEGAFVIQLLERLAKGGSKDPDLFIITPFRIIAREMRQLLASKIDLCASFGVDPARWVQDRIGTVHTFQGREADSVILLLGAPTDSQTRARHWAASTPNIVNVSVSRAQKAFYVVGSHAAWKTVGCMPVLARRLASEMVPTDTTDTA